MLKFLSKVAEKAIGPDRLAKISYDGALRSRSDALVSLRKAAAEEILFVYPDAIFITSRHNESLIGVSARSNKFIVGYYVDEYFPEIRPANSASEQISAIKEYQSELLKFKDGFKRDGLSSAFLYDETKADLRRKGYSIYTTEREEVNEVEISINNSLVAKSSGWSTILDPGELAQRLYSEIFDFSGPNRQGISDLLIKISYEAGYGSDKTVIFHLYFNEQDRNLKEQLKPVADILNLLDDKISIPAVLLEARASSAPDDDIPF